jgi:hypothetical protein
MSQANSFRRARLGLRRPATISVAVLTSIALLTLPASAGPLELNHESTSVAPIEIVEPSTSAHEFEAEREDAAIETVPADPLMEAASDEMDAEAPQAPAASDAAAEDMFPDSPEFAEPAETTAAKPASQDADMTAAQPHGETDIYDQWSRKKFKHRRKKKPHPLAAELPDHFVVVCQANCDKEKAHVVYLERRDARGPVNKKPLKAGVVAGTTSIDCVGGCYGKVKSYASMVNAQGAGGENGWVTNGTKGKPEKKGTSSDGRWYDRIN